MCIRSKVKEIFLKLVTKVMRPSCWHQNFGPHVLSAPAQGLCTCIKSWKNMHKIKRHSRAIFWIMQPVIKVIRPFCFHQKLSPMVVSSCPGAIHVYMYEIKQNIILNNEAKRIFLEFVQNDGNNKSFKMLPELEPSGCMPMPWVFFKWWPCVDLDHFMTGSDLFPDASVWVTDYTALSAHVFPSLF